jgi:hypothetical protein
MDSEAACESYVTQRQGVNIPALYSRSPTCNVTYSFGFLLSFRLQKLMEDVEAHKNFEHLDKVCLLSYLFHIFLSYHKVCFVVMLCPVFRRVYST